MNLDVLLPSRRLLLARDVTRMVAETDDGAFGLLPHRRDCVAALTPGILCFETPQDGERFVAVDLGVLVKTGPDVRVSVRRAIAGADLRTLRASVEREFLAEDALARSLRRVIDKLETAFLSQLGALGHG